MGARHKWEQNDSHIDMLFHKLEQLVVSVSSLTNVVKSLPNITTEILDITNTIQKDTEELRGMFHAK